MATKLLPISGFPEFTPEEQIVFQNAMDLIRKTYESFGFLPIETPIVERTEHLLAKGIAEKEVYGLRRLQADGDESKLALRFDLTVPLARYVAQHYGKLIFPFRRYQIQPVWRGERAQKGRYRQFYQCDIDVIGDGKLSLNFDAEIPAIIYSIFRQMGIGPFTIRVNNRKILQGLFGSMGLENDHAIRAAMKIVDGLEKVPEGETHSSLQGLGLTASDADRLISVFKEVADDGAAFKLLHSMLDIGPLFEEGVTELERVMSTSNLHVASNDGSFPAMPAGNQRSDFRQSCRVDLSIARGLDYYTGTVYETRLNDHPGIGSICSGGRYADLASKFIDRQLPGVGISIGLTRLIPQLIEAGVMKADTATLAQVLVTVQNPSRYSDYLDLASMLRQGDDKGGVAVEIYSENRKLDKQLKYANRKGFPVVIVANSEELDRGVVKVKNMRYGQEEEVVITQLLPCVKMLLS